MFPFESFRPSDGRPCRFVPVSAVVRALLACGVAVAAAAVGAADALAAEPAVDLRAIAARADAAVADPSTSARALRRYAAIRRRVARADVPGLADDFTRLDLVVRDIRGSLVRDAALADAVDAALRSGLTAFEAADAAVVSSAAAIHAARDRATVDAILRRARNSAARADAVIAGARAARACRVGRAAAGAFDRAAAVAGRILARQGPPPATWTTVVSGLDAALLSVYVAAAGDAPVIAVGAADAEGPLFLRGDASGLARVDVGGSGAFWWTDAVPGDGVWAAGEAGRVVVYDPATGALDERAVPSQSGLLYGLWGSGPLDVWAVGEDPDAEGPLPAAFRWDGVAWSAAALPPEAAGRTLYKVWGASADDVWACGRGGVLLHFDGAEWSSVASGTDSSLLTVHGAGATVAVGLAPVIVERGAAGVWTPAVLPAGTERLNGVRAGADGDVWAVGYFRTVLRRGGDGWTKVAGVPASAARDFHAVTIDAAGDAWIAGGNLISLTGGALVRVSAPRD